jgi:exodeoxyribonuclease V gamma subunit
VGTCVYDELHRQVAAFLSTLESRLTGNSLEPLEFTLHLAGCRLHGRITNIFADGLIQYRYANLKAKDHLRLWLQHLAFNASNPGHGPCRSILLGKEEVWSYEAVEESHELLTRLVEAYLAGLTKPLHFFPESSLCFAQAILEKGKAEDVALSHAVRTWTGGEFNRGEGEDLYYQLCFGQTNPLDNAFREFALEVYAPLIQARSKDRK